MRGTLLLAILSTKSSYLREVEEPAGGPTDVPDTLQWWIGRDVTWRIRTYALDHDIHTYEMRYPTDPVRLAQANNEKNYGDVIARQFRFDFVDCTDRNETDAAFKQANLEPRLEVAADRFAFWKPDDAKYRTQSTPK